MRKDGPPKVVARVMRSVRSCLFPQTTILTLHRSKLPSGFVVIRETSLQANFIHVADIVGNNIVVV